ncbi:MAG: futalosine hydrolase [Bacteroidota bacterium]|nr:futalosine hydrolase [Bacteroidota bacterium]
MFYLSRAKKSIMHVLVVAATELEVGGLRSEVGSEAQDSRLGTQDLTFLITGVGMTATAFAMGKHLATNKYDLAVNLGIAGSFDRTIGLGEVVEITEDTFADLGADNNGEFISVEQLGFGTNMYPATAKLSDHYPNAKNIKQARAITVNTVSDSESSIEKITRRLNPQLESMEGAAFFYACREMNLPCLQIRAVSNYVERRNRDNWKIGLAIKNLNTFAVEFLKAL